MRLKNRINYSNQRRQIIDQTYYMVSEKDFRIFIIDTYMLVKYSKDVTIPCDIFPATFIREACYDT